MSPLPSLEHFSINPCYTYRGLATPRQNFRKSRKHISPGSPDVAAYLPHPSRLCVSRYLFSDAEEDEEAAAAVYHVRFAVHAEIARAAAFASGACEKAETRTERYVCMYARGSERGPRAGKRAGKRAYVKVQEEE